MYMNYASSNIIYDIILYNMISNRTIRYHLIGYGMNFDSKKRTPLEIYGGSQMI